MKAKTNENNIISKLLYKLIKNGLSIFGLCMFIFFALRLGYDYYHLSHYSRTTIGQISAIDKDYKGNKIVRYEYKVKYIRYDGTAGFDERIKPKVDDFYRVKYSYKDPSVSKMEFDK